MTFPDQVIEVSMRAEDQSDQEKLGPAIQRLLRARPDLLREAWTQRPPDHHRRYRQLHLEGILVDGMKPRVQGRRTLASRRSPTGSRYAQGPEAEGRAGADHHFYQLGKVHRRG